MQIRGKWMRTPAFQIEKQGSGNVSKDGHRKCRVRRHWTYIYAAVKKLREEEYVYKQPWR